MCEEDDEVVLSTNKGKVIRQRVKDIAIQGRKATGVLIQRIEKDESIVMVDIIPPSGASISFLEDEADMFAVEDHAISAIPVAEDAVAV